MPSAEAARSLPLGDLLAFGSQLRVDITPAQLLHDVAATIHTLLPSPVVYVRLRHADTDALELAAAVGMADEALPQLQTRAVPPSFYQNLLQPAYHVSESYQLPPEVPVEPGPSPSAGGMLLVPLRGRAERLLGLIYISLPEERFPLDAEHVQPLEAIARQAALALENVRLADRSARLLAKEQLLAELGRDVSASLNLETILSRTIARMEVAFHGGSIALLDGATLVWADSVAPTDEEARAVRVSVGAGMVGSVVQHGLPFLSNQLEVDMARGSVTLVPGESAAFFSGYVPLAACIVVPLRSGGQIIGTLNVGSSQPAVFSYDDVDLLEAIAAQISGPITSARLFRQLQHVAEQDQRRAAQLTVLNGLARTATASLDLNTTLVDIISQIQHGFGYSHVELFLLDESTDELVLSAGAGERRQEPLGFRQHASTGLLGRAARTGETQQVDDVRLSDVYQARAGSGDTRAELCVPVVANERVLGVINLESREVAAFTHEDVAVLETAADILAGALENERLTRRTQEAAVLEERNRLARDLHDSVTQQLFSMTLTAKAARAQLARNPERAAAQLERLQETASAALAEMRALIFQLRPPALSDQGLVAALNQHAATLSMREGLRIEIAVSGDERHARGIEQPLYRIVQEALNNVVKHAHASNVRVQLEFSAERVRVQVVDDGDGFEVDAPQLDGRHLGLVSMRERAAEVGGSMELRSAIGGGTTLVVTVARQ
ncbi:MAG: GAF domain-containing protein [Chloroflexaceae bacterium]|jgi:signal transduction histidine kinase|nr:GAF domain-containing protein [Chloroflexaceae bacterium]